MHKALGKLAEAAGDRIWQTDQPEWTEPMRANVVREEPA